MRIKSFNYIKYLCPCLFQIFEASVVYVYDSHVYWECSCIYDKTEQRTKCIPIGTNNK